jgi:hypothetical protein
MKNSKNNCEDCGSRLTKAYEDCDALFCNNCIIDGEAEFAQIGTWRHLFNILICIFHFKFSAALGCLVYATESFFSIGDYNPKTGRFYKLGYLKR